VRELKEMIMYYWPRSSGRVYIVTQVIGAILMSLGGFLANQSLGLIGAGFGLIGLLGLTCFVILQYRSDQTTKRETRQQP
jgi:hypothetical protein